jgi:hypothetical protein
VALGDFTGEYAINSTFDTWVDLPNDFRISDVQDLDLVLDHQSFEAVGDYLDGHPRGPLGEAEAHRRLGDRAAADAALERARRARELFAETGRPSDAHLMKAIELPGRRPGHAPSKRS